MVLRLRVAGAGRKSMAAPKANRFWEARSSHGRKPIFACPEELWEACVEYFDWVADNPLHEGIAHQGKVSDDALPKMRAMTIGGLCVFLDIGEQTWRDYGKREDFSGVTTRAEGIIRQQKFEGAAAGLLSANIIARDLGLADKANHEHSGPGGEPIKTEEIGSKELARQVAFLLSAAAQRENAD